MSLYLRKAVKTAESEANKLSIYLQDIERCLVFVGFDEKEQPQVTMCNGGEVIALYRGSEISAPTFIEIMEERGYITKEDFIL